MIKLAIVNESQNYLEETYLDQIVGLFEDYLIFDGRLVSDVLSHVHVLWFDTTLSRPSSLEVQF